MEDQENIEKCPCCNEPICPISNPGIYFDCDHELCEQCTEK